MQTNELQFQDVRQNFYDQAQIPVFPALERVKEDDELAAYSKTFIKRISAVSYTLRNHAHHMEVKP